MLTGQKPRFICAEAKQRRTRLLSSSLGRAATTAGKAEATHAPHPTLSSRSARLDKQEARCWRPSARRNPARPLNRQEEDSSRSPGQLSNKWGAVSETPSGTWTETEAMGGGESLPTCRRFWNGGGGEELSVPSRARGTSTLAAFKGEAGRGSPRKQQAGTTAAVDSS